MKKREDRSQPTLLRPRLVDPVLKAASVVLVEAPIGFGKSTLLTSLASADPAVLLVASPGEPGSGPSAAQIVDRLVEQLDGLKRESAIVAIDHASERYELVARIVDHPSLRSVVLADRVIGSDLLDLLWDYEQISIGAEDLRFTEDEVTALVRLLDELAASADRIEDQPQVEDSLAYVLTPATEGWPMAVTYMLDAVVGSRDRLGRAAELAHPGPDANAFVDGYLSAVDSSVVSVISALAHFDRFTMSCVDTLTGPGGLQLASAAGAVILPAEYGWYRMPLPVSMPLRARGALPADASRMLAPVLIASGGIIQGLRASIRAGCVSDATLALCGLPETRLDEVDQQALIDVAETLRTDGDTPKLALIQARAHRNLAEHMASDACIEACLAMDDGSLADSDELSAVLMEARIEQVYSNAFSPGYDAGHEVDKLRQSMNGSVVPAHSLRLQEIEALALGHHKDPRQVELAAAELQQIAIRWETLGDVARAAGVLRRLCAAALLHLGDYRAGIDALHRANEIAWERLIERALTVTLLCRMRVLAGDIDGIEGALKEANALAEATSLPWLAGYLRWTEMWVAARCSRPDELADGILAAEQKLGPLLEHETGELFRSEAATALAEVGMLEQAAEQLEAVRRVGGGESLEYAIAEIIVAARRGLTSEVDTGIVELEATGTLPATRRWRLELEQSIAHELAGDSETASTLRSAALEGADELGLRRIASMLVESAPTSGTVGVVKSNALSLRVLGRFDVRSGSTLITLPEGHVVVVIKMLALSEGPLSIELIIDALWPDVDVAIGRRRVKNVVARLRSLVGVDQIVRSNDTLALSPETDVDLHRFDAMIRSSLALETNEADRTNKLVAALELYNGTVLPADLYDEWSIEHRRSAEARALAALDRVFAVELGNRPSAAWLLDVVLRVAPSDDQRLLRVARQALAENHPACARAALERALAAAQDLDVTLDDEIGDLRFLLKSV